MGLGVHKKPNLNQESLQVPYFVNDPGFNWPERSEGEDWPLDSKNESLRGSNIELNLHSEK